MFVGVPYSVIFDLLKGGPVPPYRFARRRRHKNARDHRRMLARKGR